jgi:phospholipase C
MTVPSLRMDKSICAVFGRPRSLRLRIHKTSLRLQLVLFLVSAMAGCVGVTGTPPPPPPPAGSLNDVNHIIYMLQENRGFDEYFGQLNNYRTSHGLNADVNVTPANAQQLSYDKATFFTPFHMKSKCVEDLSSYWNESHNDRNHANPTSATAMMDGFANAAGGNSRSSAIGYDINGQRVMGYYDDTDLPYYYFMATQFAISDALFSPIMTNTPANRLYAMAGTSHGVVDKPLTQINVPTIFDELQAAGITWKNYVPDFPNGSSVRPFPAYSKYLNTNIVPMSDYFTDLQNGTLPQVVFIDRDSINGVDEHPGDDVQKGAAYVKGIVDALMASSVWKDSIFFLAYDEGGGFYDHVPPVQTVSPDGILPILGTNDTCTATTGPACDFVYTGFRLPNIIISPFSKPGYVDHTTIDVTAILKLIELRFNLKALTARDAAQPDISKLFFDFTNKPNLKPPTPPSQPTGGPCYITSLP